MSFKFVDGGVCAAKGFKASAPTAPSVTLH